MLTPWFALGAGWVLAHLTGPATLSVWQSQFYMMRFDITQPISHQSKMLISFVTKNWRHNFYKAQEDSEECFNRAADRAARDVEVFNLDRKPMVFAVFGLLAEAVRR